MQGFCRDFAAEFAEVIMLKVSMRTSMHVECRDGRKFCRSGINELTGG